MTPTDPHGPGPAHPHGHHPPEELHNDGVAHEHSDVNVRAILGFAGIIVVVSIVCAVIVWGVFALLEQQAAARDPRLSPLALPATVMPAHTTATPQFGAAAEPRLLTNEPAALRQLRQTEDAALHQYGWTNQSAGQAQVPIDQAKKLIAERGLPSRAGGADPALGTDAPAFGEATGGRSIPTGEGAARPQAPQEQPAPDGAAPAAPREPNEQPAHAPTGRGGGA